MYTLGAHPHSTGTQYSTQHTGTQAHTLGEAQALAQAEAQGHGYTVEWVQGERGHTYGYLFLGTVQQEEMPLYMAVQA